VNPLGSATFDHVGIAAAADGARIAELLRGPKGLTQMPSGVSVGRFGADERLELVIPTRAGSPIDGFLERRGPGLHHLALQVDVPLETVVEQLAAAGVTTVGGMEPSSDGRPSVFLHPSTTGGVLIELVEGPRPT
jgi:methylmalonyl-CoA/ethylmalonyl-CoA epimerase